MSLDSDSSLELNGDVVMLDDFVTEMSFEDTNLNFGVELVLGTGCLVSAVNSS